MYSRLLTLISATIASFGLAPHASGQELPSAPRVRIVGGTGGHVLVTGQLVRLTRDSVFLRPDNAVTPGDDRMLVFGRGERVEQSVGVRRRGAKGMGIGLLAGVATGAVFGTTSAPKGFRADGAGMLAILLGVPGVVIGGIIGHTSPKEVWRPLPARGSPFL